MLVFLDIDGVMVPTRSWKSPELLDDGFPAFSSKATSALQSLISDDTTIMLTTSHKANYSLDIWKKMFQKRGINIKTLKSLPENVHHYNRRDEIVKWVNFNGITENFIIIDDDTSLNDLPFELKQNLILTSPLIGLVEENLEHVNLSRRLQVA